MLQPLITLVDATIKFIRYLRYIILLPFTPILESLVSRILEKVDLRLDGKRPGDISIKNRKCIARWLAFGELGFGESYMEGWWEAGDLMAVFNKLFKFPASAAYYKLTPHYYETLIQWYLFNRQITKVPEVHYELPMDYFYLYCDNILSLSSGYYGAGAKTFDEAQLHKLELIAKKLGLRKGMRGLDLGCGFGGACKYWADNYQVEVTGLTNTPGMISYAKEHFGGDRVHYELGDWRDASGEYDFITVIELLGHVGYWNWERFFNKIHSMLKPGGRFCIQFYANCGETLAMSDTLFTHIYGAINFPRVSDILSKNITKRLKILDLQNLQVDSHRSYVGFRHRFEKNYEKIRGIIGERDTKLTHWWWVGCEALTGCGNIQTFQAVFQRSEDPLALAPQNSAGMKRE